jgi:ADP-ribose pyrophosphatase
METVAINYHADTDQVDDWQFKAGSDAKHVAWLEVSSSLNLYASHVRLMQLVASRHQAHW